MNKRISLIALMALTASAFTFTSCSKDDDDDSTPPVVTLNGDPAPVLTLQTSYVDLGAIAIDNEDGQLVPTVTGTVNKDKVGSYTLTYSATDFSGNTGSALRTVTYENELESDPFEGSYDVTITGPGGPYTYSESLSVSTTLNNALEWSKFGNYSNANAKLNIFFSGTQVTVPTQTIIAGTIPVARTFSGNGTQTGNGSAGSTIVLNIDETVNGVTDSFVYTYTKN